MSARKYKKLPLWQATEGNETLTSSTLTTIRSMNLDTRSSSMPASLKSKKSSSSTGALKKSKTPLSTGASTKSKSSSNNPSERDIFESSNADSNSNDWLTLDVKTIIPDKSKLISEKSINENSDYSSKSPERIREALAPISDIYNPNKLISRIDEDFGILRSQKGHYITDEHYPAKSTTILESPKIASVEAPIVTEQVSDLENLSDTSSESLHVLHEENRKVYLAPTEDSTWNERWYDTRKKISPRRQKFKRKWTLDLLLEIISGKKKRRINVEPEEIKFHEADLRIANELWDDFMAEQPANLAASWSTAPKRKFFKKNAKANSSKRTENDENGEFSRRVCPCGTACVRRKLIDTDSDSDSPITFSEWRMARRLRNKRRNADNEAVASTSREIRPRRVTEDRSLRAHFA